MIGRNDDISILEVKVETLQRGLILAKDLGLSGLDVEFDSLTLVNLLKSSSPPV